MWAASSLRFGIRSAGFCGETEDEHAATLDLVQRTQYDQAFIFAYSERSKTFASRHLQVGLALVPPGSDPADCCCGNVSIDPHRDFL